jgi:Toxin SymE, type I toxin-antitoxin system
MHFYTFAEAIDICFASHPRYVTGQLIPYQILIESTAAPGSATNTAKRLTTANLYERMTMATSESTTPESGDVQLPATAETRPPEKFKERLLTVGDCSIESSALPEDTTGDRWRKATPPAPFLRLEGRWLDKAGFSIGARVRVDVTPGRLVIETVPVIPERVPHLPRRAERLFF